MVGVVCYQSVYNFITRIIQQILYVDLSFRGSTNCVLMRHLLLSMLMVMTVKGIRTRAHRWNQFFNWPTNVFSGQRWDLPLRRVGLDLRRRVRWLGGPGHLQTTRVPGFEATDLLVPVRLRPGQDLDGQPLLLWHRSGDQRLQVVGNPIMIDYFLCLFFPQDHAYISQLKQHSHSISDCVGFEQILWL